MSRWHRPAEAFESREPRLFEATTFSDVRGNVQHFGDLSLSGSKRMYFIENSEVGRLRGWHGHRFEHKAFTCVRGKVVIRSVEIANWERPERLSRMQSWILDGQTKQLLVIPGGFANSIESLERGSIVLVQSNKTIDESLADDYRWAEDYFELGH